MATLRSERLTLTPLRIADAAALFEVRGDPEAMAYWDWPGDADPDATAAVVRDMLDEVAAGTALYWTILLTADGSYIGTCDLSDLDGGMTAELGFMLARRCWIRWWRAANAS